MLSSPLTPASQKPSWDKRRILIVASFFVVAIGVGIAITLLCIKKDSKPLLLNAGTSTEGTAEQGNANAGSVVIQFKDGKQNSESRGTYTSASSGTLVRARLLNTLETFDTVPAFAQITDYSLGQRFYGWTLVGEATSDANVNRIKMSFKLARNPQGKSAVEIAAQALSLDGTLGVKANKVEGIAERAFIGGARNGASSIGKSFKASTDLSSLLLHALIQGLETETTSDLGTSYNRATALRLDPGQEFFIQLTENL